MHILLTDILTCPRCGPDFGLIVLADRLDDRKIIEGRLGCANCRQSYPVLGGSADLQIPDVPPLHFTGEFEPDAERVFRVAALLGVTEPNRTVLIVASDGAHAASVADTLQSVHVVGASSQPAVPQTAGVLSSIRTPERLPLRSGSVHGVALLGTFSALLLEEAARVLAPGGRLVVDPAPEGLSRDVGKLGLEVHFEQEGVMVAASPGRS